MTVVTRDELSEELGPIIRLEPSPEERSLRESVAGLAADFGRGYYLEKTRARQAPTELWAALGEQGYLGACLPEDYGGGGAGLWALTAVSEELAAAGMPLLSLIFAQAISGNILARHGSEEQKQRWLPRICSGELKMGFSITEPDAGSNTHNISTRARREGDKFILNGSKTFNSGLEVAEEVLVVARTGEHPDTGRGLLSLFVVDPTSPGFGRQHIPTAVQAGDEQWMLFFDNVEIGADRLVGEQDNGLRIAFEGLNPERILTATMCNGIGRYALERATAYVNERSVWGVPIGTHQAVAHPLAQAKIELELAQLMTRKATVLYEAGSPNAGEASNMAKFAAARAGVHCLDATIQVHGGNGVALEYGLVDLWWLVRFCRIGPVSEEMVLNHIAEHTLGLPKSY